MTAVARTIFISAGDVSGDQHAATLVRELKLKDCGLRFVGFGGEALASEGVDLFERLASDPVMGFRRVLGRIPRFLGLLSGCDRFFRDHRPDLVVLVDYPGFNVPLGALARRRAIPTFYYICPQFWAWAPWRMKQWARATSEAAVIFPFEVEIFGKLGPRVHFFGHPIADRFPGSALLAQGESPASPPLPPFPEQQRHRRADSPTGVTRDSSPAAEAEPCSSRIALLPGSRRQEIDVLLPWMLQATKRLRQEGRRLEAVSAHPDRAFHAYLRQMAEQHGVPLEVRADSLPAVLAGCQFAFIASGTATLEAALALVPSVVLYHVSRGLLWLRDSLLLSPFIAQPNLLAAQEVFPEIVASTPPLPRMLEHARRLLDQGPDRQRCLDHLTRLRSAVLQPGVAARAATHIPSMLASNRKPEPSG